MTEAVWLSISVDRRQPDPLYLQLYRSIRDLIEQGAVTANQELPASRQFARELGVSRATIVAAYEQLTAEGYLQGRQGSGVRVMPLPKPRLRRARPQRRRALPKAKPPPAFPGLPDMRLFPHRHWARAVVQAVRAADPEWVYEQDPFGSPRLRRAIADYLAERRQFDVDPERIAITAGAAGAIDLMLEAFTRPGDPVAVENPSHPYIPALVRRRALNLLAAPADEEGVETEGLEALEPKPRLLIGTPSHQFPLGGALSAGRRRALLGWAYSHRAIIVEDDYDSEFRYDDKPFPPLAAADDDGCVAYIGSFSKVLSGGLRLGFAIAPYGSEDRVREAMRGIGDRASAFPQTPLALFIERGDLARHVRRMRHAYGERRLALLNVLRGIGPDILRPAARSAGMHLLAHLGPGLTGKMTDVELAELAQKAGAAARPLSSYYFQGPVAQGLLLGFSGSTPSELQEIGERLKPLIRQAMPTTSWGS